MTQASCEQVTEVADVATTDAQEPASAVRRTRWQGFLIAIGGLVLIVAVAFGVMAAGGAVIHAFDPTRHMNIFAAFHNAWVVGVLLGITVLWLLPPYPWAKRAVASGSREQPAPIAGGTGDGDRAVVTVPLDAPGPGAVPRPFEDRRGGTSPLGDS